MDKNPRGKEEQEMQRLAVLLTGQMFGEASWVYGQQAMSTVIARSECKLWVISHAHVGQLASTHTEVQDHLEKVTRMKLQFRLSRLDTLNRARKSLQPARSNRGLNAWGEKMEKKKPSSPSSSSSSFASISVKYDQSVIKAANTTKARARAKTPKATASRSKTPKATASRSLLKSKTTRSEAAQASYAENIFITTPRATPRAKPRSKRRTKPRAKPLPRVSASDRRPKRFRRCDNIPREVLASVVDDFNSGDPELTFPQRQLVMAIDKYLRGKSKRPKRSLNLPMASLSPWTLSPR